MKRLLNLSLLILLLMPGTVLAVPQTNAERVTSLEDGDRVVLFAPNSGAVPTMENRTVDFTARETVAYGSLLHVPDDAAAWKVKANGDGTISFLSGEYALSCGCGVGLVLSDADGADTAWTVTADQNGYLVRCACVDEPLAIGVFDGAFTVRPYREELHASFLLQFYRTNEDTAVVKRDAVGIRRIEALGDADRFRRVALCGTVAARLGNYGELYGAVLADGTAAVEVFAPLLTDSTGREIRIGDRVAILAEFNQSGALSYLEDPAVVRVIGAAEPEITVFTTFSELKADARRLAGHAVLLRGVRLGAWQSDEMTILTDRDGATLPLYRAAPYPNGVSEGELADLLCVVEFRGDFLQLRNGDATDYLPHGGMEPPSLKLLTTSVRAGGRIRVAAQSRDGIAYVRIRLYRGAELVLTTYLYPAEGEYTTELPDMVKSGAYAVELQAASVRHPRFPATERGSLTVGQ